MSQPNVNQLRESLVLRSALKLSGERAALYRSVASGALTHVARGVYVETQNWAAWSPRTRYRAAVVASALIAREPMIYSHESAALLWKLPWVGAWPEVVHVTTDAASGGRSSVLMSRHTLGVPEPTEVIDGLAVTTLARTVVDLAARLPFDLGVVVADAALRRTFHSIAGVPRTSVTADDLERELHRVPLRHGSARARRTLNFADERADRPGESLSRVTICLAGITPPQLQVVMHGASGRRYVVDFWWPEFNVIGEFDGVAKYSDPEILRGRTPEQALIEEKKREDDLRATNKGFARWGWSEARSIPLLTERLRQAGVR